MNPRKIVYTTTNTELLKKFVPELHAYQLVQKPYDFEQLINAVKQQLNATAG